jgi:hypothetical protein
MADMSPHPDEAVWRSEAQIPQYWILTIGKLQPDEVELVMKEEQKFEGRWSGGVRDRRNRCGRERKMRPRLTLDIIVTKGLWLVFKPLEVTLDRVWSKSTPSFVFRFFLLGRHYWCDKTWFLSMSIKR